MEPLSAIGLAAEVVQFVQFTESECELVHRFHEGSYENFRAGLFVDITRHFFYFSSIFKSQLQNGSSQSPEARRLEKLIHNCYRTAAELRNICLTIASDEVVKDPNANISLRIRKVREFWEKPDIHRFLTTVNEYRHELVLCMLAYLPACLEAMYQKQSANPNRSHSKIEKIVAVVQNSLDSYESRNGEARHRTGDIQVSQNTALTFQHGHAIAAVITLQNGETKLLTRTVTGNHFSPDKQPKFMTMRNADVFTVVEDFKPIQDMILDSLYFRQYQERLETVKDAHKKTYEWVFCPPEDRIPWDPLVEWLERGTGCYYINGKPGSGKSTLMKFIAQHERTGAALKNWAGGTPIRASFFFWNLGSPLQKSSIGLLRGLLYDILTQQPWLISLSMPDLWNAAARLPAGSNLGHISLEDLQRYLRNALNEKSTAQKFFLIVDGVDEFEGDHHELVELINDVVRNKNVKILVSSRPTPLSQDSFSHWPSLRLQDLTKGDIQKYAADHLSPKLNHKHGGQWAALIDEITNRSYGVFLWVILVVRSLEDGLRKGDNIKEMRMRLDELPSDLKDLYDHIIRNLELRYQRQASELFQLLLKAQQVQSSAGYPFLIQVSFCRDDPEEVVSLPMGPLDPAYHQDKCNEITSRIRSRSCGLIESREWRTNHINVTTRAPISYNYVDFIHRTVVEFLRLPEVWTQVINLTAEEKYDPSPQLFLSCVAMCKTLPTPRGIQPEVSTLWHMADRALVYASIAEDSKTPVSRAQLKELDAVVTKHWSGIMKCFSRLGTYEKGGHWANGYTVDPQKQHLLRPTSFASVVLFHGLEDYLIAELSDPTTRAALDTTLLLYTCMQYIGPPPWDNRTTEFDGSLTTESALYIDRQEVLRPRWANIAIRLLDAGCTEPNKPVVDNNSAWSAMVSYLAAAGAPQTKQRFHRDLEANREGFANLFAKLIATFIKQRADLNLQTTAGVEPAWKLVEQLFSGECGSSEKLDPWARQPSVEISFEVMKMREYFEALVAEHKV